ncbi:hypothetical protein [Nostoc sp.]|uniref:hypothetical protein n=1 Tax=Nostoc sp. TaxID=1180 RepID=UPI002FF5F752
MTSQVIDLLTQNLIQLTAINKQYGIELHSIMSSLSEQKKRTEVLEVKFDALNGASDYCTVRGYCKLNGIRISEGEARSLGTKAGKICRQKSYNLGKVQDERHGQVNTYPIEVLDEVVELYKKKTQ